MFSRIKENNIPIEDEKNKTIINTEIKKILHTKNL